MPMITVESERPYPVQIGRGILLETVAGTCRGADRVMIVHARPLASRARELAEVLADQSTVVSLFEVPDGEQAKSVTVLTEGWSRLAEAGFTRSDLVVGLGGGATTDLAGFLAASWLRGVGFVNVPTTALAMVDAAVGGKTGINIEAGKNLVGAFHEPQGVVCDLDVLTTLPRPELVSGLAEVVKCGFIADQQILELISSDRSSCLDVTSDSFAELVQRAITVKAEVVAADLRESTSHGSQVGREKLNYGHTLGHAIEKHERFRWRHGEAISVGMVFVAELSRQLLGLDDALAAMHADLLDSLELPVSYRGADFETLRSTMALDKKSRGNVLRLVGLRAQGQVAMIENPSAEALRRAWRAVS